MSDQLGAVLVVHTVIIPDTQNTTGFMLLGMPRCGTISFDKVQTSTLDLSVNKSSKLVGVSIDESNMDIEAMSRLRSVT